MNKWYVTWLTLEVRIIDSDYTVLKYNLAYASICWHMLEYVDIC